MKIPKNAKRVFKGLIYDVHHFEQEMFDGSKETFEMLKRPDTVQIIAIVGDKIIVAHQEQPTKPRFYSLFGGRVDAGEDVLAAAKRELLEESGHTSSNWELYKVYEPYHKMDYKIYYYIAHDAKKTAKPKPDVGEKIDVVELDFEKLIDLVSQEGFEEIELANDILRMQLDKKKLAEFKKQLFPSL